MCEMGRCGRRGGNTDGGTWKKLGDSALAGVVQVLVCCSPSEGRRLRAPCGRCPAAQVVAADGCGGRAGALTSRRGWRAAVGVAFTVRMGRRVGVEEIRTAGLEKLGDSARERCRSGIGCASLRGRRRLRLPAVGPAAKGGGEGCGAGLAGGACLSCWRCACGGAGTTAECGNRSVGGWSLVGCRRQM